MEETSVLMSSLMSPHLDISSLPPDIIRIIVPMGEESMEGMRLISRTWNSIVLSHFKDPRHLLPIERLYIHNVVPRVEMRARQQPYQPPLGSMVVPRNSGPSQVPYYPPRDPHVHIHAVIPEQCAHRIGLGKEKWMKVNARFLGVIEVTCDPQKFARPVRSSIVCFCCLQVVVILFSSLISFLIYNSPWSILIGSIAGVALFSIYWRTKLQNEEKLSMGDKNRSARFTRFISSFSRIDSLVLDSLCDHYYNYKIFDGTTLTFGNIQIERLEVKEFECGTRIQKRLIELTRKHRIRHISIIVEICTTDSLRNFLLKLAKMGATVHIYQERLTANSNRINIESCFFQPIEFWNAMATDLLKEGISLKITTDQDVNFNALRGSTTVRALISCMSTDCEPGRDFPVDFPIPRGFSRFSKHD